MFFYHICSNEPAVDFHLMWESVDIQYTAFTAGSEHSVCAQRPTFIVTFENKIDVEFKRCSVIAAAPWFYGSDGHCGVFTGDTHFGCRL